MNVAAHIISYCTQSHLMITTAESCTGGMIATALTDIAGSSAVFDRGFITYSNEAKINMLGVSLKTLERHGAVSEQTAREMALGALENSRADISIAVTGIAGPGGGTAGPGGGTDEKPIGLVYLGIAKNEGVNIHKLLLGADKTRDEIRKLTVARGLNELLKITAMS